MTARHHGSDSAMRMSSSRGRRTVRTLLVSAAIVALLVASTGCRQADEDPATLDTTEQGPRPLVIGALSTEDTLPLWVAEELGLFAEAGLDDVSFVTFQAASERDAAFSAGEIDAFMGDIIAAAQLEAGGIPVTIGTVMLGATPAEGRFGIVASPDAAYNDLEALAGVPVGTSSATIQEYVLDGLMRQAGVDEADIVIEPVDKVPVRYELLMNDQIEAAALPEPFLTLAEEGGATLLADDTTGENLSQTVLVFGDEYLAEPGGIETLSALLGVWDEAVGVVNADPDAWRDTLVDKARLPETIKDTYRVNAYPESQTPTQEQVTAVLDWMTEKGYLDTTLSYEELVIVFP